MKENSKVHDCCRLHNDLSDQGKAPATRTDQASRAWPLSSVFDNAAAGSDFNLLTWEQIRRRFPIDAMELARACLKTGAGSGFHFAMISEAPAASMALLISLVGTLSVTIREIRESGATSKTARRPNFV